MESYTVKVEESRPAVDGKPSAGPVYRCIYAKDGLMEMPVSFESPWDFFRYITHLNISILFFFIIVVNFSITYMQ